MKRSPALSRTAVSTVVLSAVTMLAAGAIGVGTAAAATAGHHPKRPPAEHVPLSLHRAHLTEHHIDFGHRSKSRTVTGKQAKRLIRAFDRMTTQPTDYIHCEIAGGPVEIVTFRTARHTWVVREGVCTNIIVTRDGKALPTLLANAAWDNAIRHDLGH